MHAKKLPISVAPTGLRVYIFPQVREKLYIKFPKRQVWQFFKCARCARKFRLPGYSYLVMIISFFRNRAKNLKCRNMLYYYGAFGDHISRPREKKRKNGSAMKIGLNLLYAPARKTYKNGQSGLSPHGKVHNTFYKGKKVLKPSRYSDKTRE